jgi:hypothetical protein
LNITKNPKVKYPNYISLEGIILDNNRQINA